MAQEVGIGFSFKDDGMHSAASRSQGHCKDLAGPRVGARILIIDDYEPFRASVKDLLEATGYDVAVAVDGEDGIQQFQRQPFDLVLCDVFMPKKDGMETIRDLRKLSTGTPIISMTARRDAFEADFLQMTSKLGAT